MILVIYIFIGIVTGTLGTVHIALVLVSSVDIPEPRLCHGYGLCYTIGSVSCTLLLVTHFRQRRVETFRSIVSYSALVHAPRPHNDELVEKNTD